MANLNRTDLVAAVAAESGQSQGAVNGVLDALFSTLAKSVAEGTEVSIPGWLKVEQTARAARIGLQKLPRNASPVRLRHRDAIDGRPRGNIRLFGISRVRFREMAHRGELPGITKSSW